MMSKSISDVYAGLGSVLGLALACLFLSACQSTSSVAESPEATVGSASVPAAEYILGPGDEIDINVWRRTELNRSVIVGPTGKITIPLIGQVRAQGMTLDELQAEVTKSLKKYYVDPIVDVTLTGARSQRYYVFGEVSSPGVMTLTRSIRVWQAILVAGGFNDDANQEDVILIHTNDGTPEAEVLTLDVASVIGGSGGDGGPVLRDGDIIYVPQKFIADVEDFMTRLNNLVQPITTVERGIVLGDEAWKILKSTDDSSDGVVIAQ
jgi:protein involved in polysaccharide export with SLBB domain